jgi:hypothetical protein
MLVERQVQHPAGQDQPGVSEGASAAHVAALVERPDPAPPQRVAKLALGNAPQRVPILHRVRAGGCPGWWARGCGQIMGSGSHGRLRVAQRRRIGMGERGLDAHGVDSGVVQQRAGTVPP